MPDNLSRHKSDAPDVRVPILATEPQSFGQVSANDITVEQRHLSPAFEKQDRQDVGGRRLSCAAQPGKPDTESLLVARRTAFGQDFGHLGRTLVMTWVCRISELIEEHGRHSDLVAIAIHQIHRLVGIAIVSTDKQEIGPEVPLNDGVPQGFARPGVTCSQLRD